MSRSESIFSRIYREYQCLSAAASSEQTGNDTASSRTKSTCSPSTRCNRPPRSRSLRFEPLESRELLSLTQPLTDDVAPTCNVAPQTPAAVPAEIVAPLAFAPEPASTPEAPAVPISISTLEPAATQEAEESATSETSNADESPVSNAVAYNAHDLAVVRRARVDPEDCQWDSFGRLTDLCCPGNQLTSLDVSGCAALRVLNCHNNQLTSLDVSGCAALRWLDCADNQLTSLDVSGCAALQWLDCADNQLTSLDVSGCAALQYLRCYDNQLTSLDVSGCAALRLLSCFNNQLTSLDVSGCAALQELYCENNQLTSLEVSGCAALQTLGCDIELSRVKLASVRQETCCVRLYLYNTERLRCDAYYWNGSGLKVEVEVDGEYYDEYHCECYWFELAPDAELPVYVDCYREGATKPFHTLVIGEADEAEYNEHDVERLRGFLSQNGNGAKVNSKFKASDPETYGVEWTEIDGEYRLTAIDWRNKKLTGVLDLSGCANLEKLDVSKNKLTSLNVDDCDALEEIDASENELTDFSPISLESVKKIDVSFNKLKYLYVTWLYELEELRCVQNSLESLNFYSLRSLKTLVCGNNPNLTEIGWQTDDSYESLETLECWNTGLKTLDVSAFSKLTYLACYGDKLQSIYVPDVCDGGTVDISKLKIDLTRYKTEIDTEEVEEKEGGAKVYPNEASYYSAVNMRETGVWIDNNNIELNEHTGEISIFKPQTTTFKARFGGAETDVLLPSYGVVYDKKSHEVAGVVRVYGSFFTLPEILLKQDNFDHWKNSTDGTATLLDPLRFDPIHGRELTMYFDLPYEIDEKWIDEANGLDAYGLTLREEFADSSLFEDRKAALIFPGTDSRLFAQTGFGLADVAIDCDPRGVGYGQYETHKSSFQRWLERNGDKTLPNVYGYSLGAALAQWTISDYVGSLKFVEIFNTPGISVEAAAKFNSSRVEKLTYHIASGDPVSMAGETVLPGGCVLIYSYSSSTELGAWIEAKHLSPLSVPYSFAGNVQMKEGTSEGTLRFGRPAANVANISSDVYRSFWFHYDDVDYTTWRTNAFLSALAPDVLAVRGTTEQGRAKLRGVVKPSSQTAGLAALGTLLKTPVFSVGATVALGNSVANLYDLRQYRMEFGNGWKLEQINEDLTCVDGKLSEGTVKVTTPNGWELDGTLNYGTSGDKKYGLESLTVVVDGEEQVRPKSSYYLSNAVLKMNKIPELYQTETDYELSGDGKISYQYRPTIGKNQELASIKGDIKIGANVTSVSGATLCVGDVSGQFFALGQTNEFKIVSKIGADERVPLGGAYGKFNEITLSTDYGVREQNVNYFKLQDATVVWDKQGKVMGFRECVTITGTLTVGKRTLSVEARYFGAGSGDWRVTIKDGQGETVLTPENSNFEYVPPFVLADLGEISATSAASASVFDASKVSEKTRVSLANGWNDAASLARLDVADAPTAVLRCEWTNACDAPGLRFESPSGVDYSEAEMLELGYLQRISAGNESVARSYLTFLSADEFGEWRVTSAAALTDGTATLYETSATTHKPEAKAVDATFDEENGAVAVVVELEKADVDLADETFELVWINVLEGDEESTVATTNVALKDAEVDATGRLTFVLNVAELGLPNGDYRLVARVGSTFATVASQAFAFEPVARLEASETTLKFGSVDLDAANDDAENAGVVERTLTLKNAGSKTAVFALSPTGSAGTTDFYVAGLYADGERVDCGNVALRPGESVELTLYFAPTAVVGREIGVELVDVESGDVLSTLCLNGLGVSQNVPTAAITSDVARVQEGCAVWLSGAASTAPNGGALKYRWDLTGSSALTEGALTDGDGGFYRIVETSGSFDARLQVVDENGVESEVALREIAVETVAPTLNVKSKTSAIDAVNILTRFDLATLFFSGRTVEQWTLNWGDGTETKSSERANAATFAHCYQAGDEAQNYVATLQVSAPDGEIYVFTLGETNVPPLVRVEEAPSLIVTTNSDAVNAFDGEISLREAIFYAEVDATLGDTITFAPSLKGQTITLTERQLEIKQGLKIDASSLYNASTQTPGITVDANGLSRVFYLNAGINEKPIELIGLRITGGRTEEDGGGIYVNSGTTTITNCAINDNEAYSGGGVYGRQESALTFTNCVINGNEATKSGGGVWGLGTLTLNYCSIINNVATIEGGGLFIRGSAALTTCDICDNSAEYGGGVANDSFYNASTFVNCLIVGNKASNAGGGASLFGKSTLTNCTITGNQAANGGGGVIGDTPTLRNTILALNWGGDLDMYCELSSDSSNNLISVEPHFIHGPIFDAEGNLTSPALDLRLSASSAAIDRGNNAYVEELTYDSASMPRVRRSWAATATVDIGAYEYQGIVLQTAETPSLVVTSGSDVVDAFDGEISLREAILYAETDATLGDTITFAPWLKGQTIPLMSGMQLEITQGIKIDASSLYNASMQTPGITVCANLFCRVFNLSGGTEEKPIELIGLKIAGGSVWGEVGEGDAGRGGGVYVSDVARFTNCLIVDSNGRWGGGVYVDYNSEATFTACSLVGNTASYGGGAYAHGEAIFTNCVIRENSAITDDGSGSGGGVFTGAGAATLTNCELNANVAGYNGGALYISSDAALIENCAILANEAIYGGGIYSYWSGSGGATPRTFLNCVVSDNTASYGGGVYSRYDEDTLTFINCAITDNEALNGGGVYLYCSEETTTFTNCVIAANLATYYGSGVYLRESKATLFNSIVALNQGNAEVWSSESSVKAYCTLSSYSEWNGGSNNYVFNPAKPLFKDATNGDYTLATNSQALDKGNNAYVADYLTDLAGKPRVLGSCVDLGAYERVVSMASVAVAELSSVASASVWEDDEFASNCDADVWREIETTLAADNASRRKERRDPFGALAESNAFDVWGDADVGFGI